MKPILKVSITEQVRSLIAEVKAMGETIDYIEITEAEEQQLLAEVFGGMALPAPPPNFYGLESVELRVEKSREIRKSCSHPN